jgi:hypothetical protein
MTFNQNIFHISVQFPLNPILSGSFWWVFEWLPMASNGFHSTNLSNVRNVAASECSYAAVLMDGGLVTWGSSHFGGDSQAVQERSQRSEGDGKSSQSGFKDI